MKLRRLFATEKKEVLVQTFNRRWENILRKAYKMKLYRIPPNLRRVKLPRWSKVETAYISGIVDGEGAITIGKRKQGGGMPQLQVTNTNRALIDWLAQKFETSAIYLHSRPRHKPCYIVVVYGERAYQVASRIRVYMLVKRPQVDLFVEYWEWRRTLKSNFRGKREHKKQLDFIRRIQALNQRGVGS